MPTGYLYGVIADMIYVYKTQKVFWEYKRNIVRIGYVFIWLLMIVCLFINFSGFERRALVVQWSFGVLGLYIGTVTMYLADVRNRNSYNNVFTMLFCRSMGVFAFIFFTYFSIALLKDTICDTFINQPIIRQVKVIERKSEYKSYDRVVFSGDMIRYKAVPGYVKLEEGKSYTVKLFTNSSIAIGLEETTIK
ncbi:MAG: hypothetical protein Q8942_19180 [Bacillota bacterium]|nr:hypothetical protein [Bacillota bacterium]